MRVYLVDFILYAGRKCVEAESPEDAAAIVEGMSDDELMDGSRVDNIIQDIQEDE